MYKYLIMKKCFACKPISQSITRLQPTNKHIKCIKTDYYVDTILEKGCDQKNLFNLTNKLMDNTKTVVLPSRECNKDTSNRFDDFFFNKIETIMRYLFSEDDSSLNGNDVVCVDVIFDGQALTVLAFFVRG